MKILTAVFFTMFSLVALAATSPDESFYKKAAEAGKAEVAAGRLAQQKGSSSAVKDFGAMMVKDHSAANMKLEALAQKKNIRLPKGMGTANALKERELKMKSDAAFDKAYIEQQTKAHEDTMALLQQESSSGQDPDAQAFARAILPTVQQHLDKIKQISAAGATH